MQNMENRICHETERESRDGLKKKTTQKPTEQTNDNKHRD